MRHYVFGYGSLICQDSRTRTAKSLGSSDTTGIPVRVLNWVRLWNVRDPSGRKTYLGVQSLESFIGATPGDPRRGETTISCVGVLFPLPPDGHEKALEDLDRRERGYTRERLNPRLIERVDDLLNDGGKVATDENTTYKNTFLDKDTEEENRDEIEACVWIYVPMPKFTSLASTEFPILQSYADICLKGCLSISDAFVKEFVAGTYGWYPGDSRRCKFISTKDKELAWYDPCSCSMINDRTTPIYSRADKEYSLGHAEALDAAMGPNLTRRRDNKINKCFQCSIS